jgi:hypothetical protein
MRGAFFHWAETVARGAACVKPLRQTPLSLKGLGGPDPATGEGSAMADAATPPLPPMPTVRKITYDDLRDVLRLG